MSDSDPDSFSALRNLIHPSSNGHVDTSAGPGTRAVFIDARLQQLAQSQKESQLVNESLANQTTGRGFGSQGESFAS